MNTEIQTQSPIAAMTALLVLVFSMAGCTTVTDLKEDHGFYAERSVPMSLDELEISIQKYNQRCTPRACMIRDLTDDNKAFCSSAHPGDNVLQHWEYQESPDGQSTTVMMWGKHSWGGNENVFDSSLYSMSNPSECIGWRWTGEPS